MACSRIKRVFELRATEIDFDAASQVFVRDCARRTIRLVAHKTERREADEYVDKINQLRRDHDLPTDPDVIFVEVTVDAVELAVEDAFIAEGVGLWRQAQRRTEVS